MAKLSIISLGANYKAPEDLEFAASDAAAIAHAFNTQVFYHLVNSTLFEANADSQMIEKRLKEEARNCGSTDCLIFFFAGHGLVEEDASGIERLYLACDTTELDAIEQTALRLDMVLDALENSPANVALSMLDCCFSGYGGRSMLGPRSLKKLRTGRAVSIPVMAKQGYGRVVLSAAGRDEKALECPVREHGLFTAALLENFSSSSPNRSSISLISLYSAVQAQVMSMSAGRQCPSLYGGEHRVNVPTTGHKHA